MEGKLQKRSAERTGYCLMWLVLWMYVEGWSNKRMLKCVGVFPVFWVGDNWHNWAVLKIRVMFVITFRITKNKSCRVFCLFLKLMDAVCFLKGWLNSTKMPYRWLWPHNYHNTVSEHLRSSPSPSPSLSPPFILFSIKSMMSGISYIILLEFLLNQVLYHPF